MYWKSSLEKDIKVQELFQISNIQKGKFSFKNITEEIMIYSRFMKREITLIFFTQISPRYVNSQLISTSLTWSSSLPSQNRSLLWPMSIANKTSTQTMLTRPASKAAAAPLVRSGSPKLFQKTKSQGHERQICLKMKMIEKVLKSDYSTNESLLMSVVMTSFSNRFLHYDAINSVIITEIGLLC